MFVMDPFWVQENCGRRPVLRSSTAEGGRKEAEFLTMLLPRYFGDYDIFAMIQ